MHICCAVPDYMFAHGLKSEFVRHSPVAFTRLKRARKLSKDLRNKKVFYDPDAGACDLVTYDARNRDQLPGELVLVNNIQHGQKDEILQMAHDNARKVLQFHKECLGRKSWDGNGCDIVSTAHYEQHLCNAFFDGKQMVYGDGDGRLFLSLAKSLDVAGHEIGHGVEQTTGRRRYFRQPGAGNESQADCYGLATKYYHQNLETKDADFLIGGDIIAPHAQERGWNGIRSFKEEKAYPDDPQPKHMRDYWKVDPMIIAQDNGGVHILSGILNNGFRHFAILCGKKFIFEDPIVIWYLAAQQCGPWSGFKDFVKATKKVVAKQYPQHKDALAQAWRNVGL